MPTTTFALAVDDNIYQRIMDEIQQANQMPCGTFFCGHHKDVDRPSIAIPLVIILVLLMVMGIAACWVEGS